MGKYPLCGDEKDEEHPGEEKRVVNMCPFSSPD
jgi:hypothetical protein